MKKVITVAAVVALIIFVCGAACVLGGYSYHRFQVEVARDDGEKFGKATDQRGCLQESLRRLREQGRDTFLQRYRRVLTHNFTSGCFQTSGATKDFCSGVPRPEEFTAGLDWRVRQCVLAGLDDGACTNVMWAMMKECGKAPLPTVSYPEERR